MPLMRCMIFKITRSQDKSTRALWTITAIDCPLRKRTPSKISVWLVTSGCEVTVPSRMAKTSRMREMQLSPESTHSFFARIVPEARWLGSMQAYVVASRVARSSCNAFSRMAVILRLVQSTIDLPGARSLSALEVLPVPNAPPGLFICLASVEGARLQPCRNCCQFMVALATEGFRCSNEVRLPSGAKAQLFHTRNGTAEAVPLQSVRLSA